MPAATGAHVYRDAVITINSVVYTNQVTKARLVPDTPIQTVRTLVPDGAITDVDSTVWTFELSGLQINVAGGLSLALRSLVGQQVTVILQPQSGLSKPIATFTIVALPAEFGGEQGSFLMSELEFPVVGAPVFGTSPAS